MGLIGHLTYAFLSVIRLLQLYDYRHGLLLEYENTLICEFELACWQFAFYTYMIIATAYIIRYLFGIQN